MKRLHIITTTVMSRLPEGLFVDTISRGWLYPTVTYYYHDRDVGTTRRFISSHGVVRLVISNGDILLPRP